MKMKEESVGKHWPLTEQINNAGSDGKDDAPFQTRQNGDDAEAFNEEGGDRGRNWCAPTCRKLGGRSQDEGGTRRRRIGTRK